MEKVIVATGYYPLSTADMAEVNNWLAKGWRVKSVTVQNSKNHMTAIYVLEIDIESEIAGTYNANALWVGHKGQFVLNKDNTYELSDGMFVETGKWKQMGNNVVLMPNGKPSANQRSVSLSEDGMGFFISGRFFSR